MDITTSQTEQQNYWEIHSKYPHDDIARATVPVEETNGTVLLSQSSSVH